MSINQPRHSLRFIDSLLASVRLSCNIPLVLALFCVGYHSCLYFILSSRSVRPHFAQLALGLTFYFPFVLLARHPPSPVMGACRELNYTRTGAPLPSLLASTCISLGAPHARSSAAHFTVVCEPGVIGQHIHLFEARCSPVSGLSHLVRYLIPIPVCLFRLSDIRLSHSPTCACPFQLLHSTVLSLSDVPHFLVSRLSPCPTAHPAMDSSMNLCSDLPSTPPSRYTAIPLHCHPLHHHPLHRHPSAFWDSRSSGQILLRMALVCF